MERESNESKLHGKKRSYFLKERKSSNGTKATNRLQITASKRERNGSNSRSTISLFLKDLPAFLGVLQECITPEDEENAVNP